MAQRGVFLMVFIFLLNNKFNLEYNGEFRMKKIIKREGKSRRFLYFVMIFTDFIHRECSHSKRMSLQDFDAKATFREEENVFQWECFCEYADVIQYVGCHPIWQMLLFFLLKFCTAYQNSSCIRLMPANIISFSSILSKTVIIFCPLSEILYGSNIKFMIISSR